MTDCSTMILKTEVLQKRIRYLVRTLCTLAAPILRLRNVPALSLIALSFCVASAYADDPDNCLMCHQYRGLGRVDQETDEFKLYFVDPEYGHHAKGPHARLACTDCHVASEVSVVPHQPTTPVNCTQTCHLSDPGGLERIFSHEASARWLDDSAHSSEVLRQLNFTGGPLLHEGQSNCLYCHDEPLFRDPVAVIPEMSRLNERTFDRCDSCHSQSVPVDVRYYINHIASRLQPARGSLDMAQVCAVCHSDPLVNEQHDMSDAVASFVRSFHGKAALLGDNSTADCLSCHVMPGENAHLMLGPDNPNSSVNVAHVADSCRSVQCHPGADLQIASTAVHLDIPTAGGSAEFLLAAFFIIATLLTFGPAALLVLLDLVQIIIGRGHHDADEEKALARRVLATPEGRRKLTRFTVKQRVEHWLLAISFTLLVLTGFPMKFADRDWASALINMFGGLSLARHIHHWSGVVLIVGFAQHVVVVLLDFWRKWRTPRPDGTRPGAWQTWNDLPMWITVEDAKKTLHLLLYLLFLKKERPTFGRFSPTEKFEYLGVFWGTVLLGITGILLWGMQLSSQFFSGRALNLATIAHTYEAFLAVIHVGILHIYNVVFAPKVFPLSRATLSGETPVDKLAEEHSELVDEVASELGITKAAT